MNLRGDEPVSYHEDFSDMENWFVEQQAGGTVRCEGGKLVIEDDKGCTVWFRHRLEAPVRIRYSVTPSAEARVSDMNCFWMASDPDHPENLFYSGHGREGVFAQYDALQLYYVGYGGNHNTTTRFRRYEGRGEKPLLEGYDLRSSEYMLEGGRTYQIELVADEEGARYFRDGELVFEYKDPEPLESGWFGFRTVWSRMEIEDFVVVEYKVGER